MALILRSDQAIVDPTGFPYLSNFGVVQDSDLAQFLDAQATAGTSVTPAEFNAFKTFLESLTSAGIKDSMISVFPVFGANASAAALPLFNRLNGGASLLNSGNTASMVISGDRVQYCSGAETGSKNYQSPNLIDDLYVKSSVFSNQNSRHWGCSYIFEKIGTTSQNLYPGGFYGTKDVGGGFYSFIRDTSSPWNSLEGYINGIGFGTISLSDNVPAIISLSANISTGAKAVGNLGSVTASATGTATTEPSATTRGILRNGINCQPKSLSDATPVTFFQSDPNVVTSFFSEDDGTLNTTAKQQALHDAIYALQVALGRAS